MSTPIVEISFSKKKYTLFLLIFLGLCVVGVSFLIDPSFETPTISAATFQIVGIILIGIFGFGAYLMIKKILKKDLAITINNEGIYDNSSKAPFGFIPWDDIIEIKTKRRSNEKFLLLFMNNPKEYIEKQSHQKAKKLLLDYQIFFETPICLTTKSFACSFTELEGIIQRRYNLFKKNKLEA